MVRIYRPKTTRPNHMMPVERDQAVRLYREGMTLDRLAEVFDRERTTVYRLVKRSGALRKDGVAKQILLTSTN